MQTLWSRVAQARGSCRCPHCATYASGVSRRATGSATRRIPKYLTSSTLWYSGIFAAAATFDAGAKNRRREQWDRAIAEVKQDLGQPAKVREEELLGLHEEAQKGLAEARVQFTPFEEGMEEGHVFQNTDPRVDRPEWPANTGPALKPFNLPPQSIYAPDEFRDRAETAKWSPKKLATIQASIDVLLTKIFIELQKEGWSHEAAQNVTGSHAKLILHNTSQLTDQLDVRLHELNAIKKDGDAELTDFEVPNSGINICSYQQDDLGNHHNITRNLNHSIQRLFDQQAANRIGEPALLAKLTFNLAISSAPPNINTYNILLIGLSRLREGKLSSTITRDVITSMTESHMRMNEVSMTTILKHYIKTNQVGNFIRMIETMRGKHGGPMLARQDINITEASGGRLMRKEDQPWKVIQLPYPTPYVFRSIVSGVCKFAGFETALSMCQGMSKEGWGLCMAGLTPLLYKCAERGDWESGQAVWTEIQALKFKSRRKNGFLWQSERIGVSTFAAMLRLCAGCGRKEYFDEVWRMANVAHPKSVGRLVVAVKGKPERSTVKSLELEREDAQAGTDQGVTEGVGQLSLSGHSRTRENSSLRPSFEATPSIKDHCAPLAPTELDNEPHGGLDRCDAQHEAASNDKTTAGGSYIEDSGLDDLPGDLPFISPTTRQRPSPQTSTTTFTCAGSATALRQSASRSRA